MRIIGGENRGRIIRMPKLVKIRPTQDRVREAIFNVIRGAIPGSDILDLYAGSGAFGIEALSRGAISSIFVDNNIKCIETIKENLNVVDEKVKNTQLYKEKVVTAIKRLGRKGLKFSLIFMDPPYCGQDIKNCLINIKAYDILCEHGFIIAEHSVKDEIPEKEGNLSLFKRNRYGDTAVSFYRKEQK